MNPLMQINVPQSQPGVATDGPTAMDSSASPMAGGGGNQPQHQGNWFTHLLPTIGGIGGGLLGGLATAGMGGEFVGAGGGAALGKALENNMEGQAVIQGNDLTAGAEGAIGQGVGGLIGKGIGLGSKFLGDAAENMLGKQGTEQAAADAASSIAARQTAYKDVPLGLQKAYNGTSSLDHVKAMGFDDTNPDHLLHVANTSNDALNSKLNEALAGQGPVDLSKYENIIKGHIADQGNTLGSFDPTTLAKGKFGAPNTPAGKLLGQLQDLGAGINTSNADPEAVRNLTTKLYSLAQDAKPGVSLKTGAVDPEQRAIYNVINNVRNDVKSTLYDRPGVNQALQGAAPNIQASDVGSQQLADHLNSIIAGAGKGANNPAQDYLTNISKNIDINNLGKEGLSANQIITSTGAKNRALVDAGVDPHTVVPQQGSDLNNAANALGAVGSAVGHPIAAVGTILSHAAQSPMLLDTLAKAGKLTAKLAPPAGVLAATAPNLAAAPVTDATINQPTNNGMTMQPQQQQPQQPNDYQNLIHAMMAQSILAPEMTGSGGATSFLQSIAPQLQHNALAGAQISGLNSAFANAGGAQGTGGILSKISSLIPGTAANTYEHQRNAAASQLAQTLGISPEAAAGILPQLMQNQTSATQQQSILGGLQGQLAN